MSVYSSQKSAGAALASLGALLLCVQLAAAVITVQIGGANRLSSLTRQRERERYNCYWDCDLVGCQIARDDDECAYDCEKICRVRYDYAGRSGELKPKSASDALAELTGKLDAPAGPSPGEQLDAELAKELVGAGTSVRLNLPRNASARNFAIWERCSADQSTGKLTEKPFSL